MKKALIQALAQYGRTIRKDGWKAGEPLIAKNEKRFKDFKRWAYALSIVLRANELLEEKTVG